PARPFWTGGTPIPQTCGSYLILIPKYKIRVGDYRIGLTVDAPTKTLICQRVAHRRDIYRIFP
ncbi:hypothetical protein QUA08_23760, partial [Microcoleus sp. T3B2]|uniref:type II toxin-antitoxin system RelE family toxin n=1 Tax=Microcoleus sp. T3B2 TaxID=3055426 RepID=UPI003B179E77